LANQRCRVAGGKPEVSGSWIVWGRSGNGKTSYVLQLTRYLAEFERVHYVTLEEGMRESFKLALDRANIKSVKGRVSFSTLTYDNLVAHLSKKRMPKVVVIDSLQYFFRKKNLSNYFDLLHMFPNTLFIFISHAQGSEPKGSIADDIMFHSDVKIHVKDFIADVVASRFGGTEAHIIWQAGADAKELKLLQKG